MPSVAILLATYNGAAHLQAQLDSFFAQTHTDWRLCVSDDGSSDDTRTIIEQFARNHPAHRVTLIEGPRQGYARNFMQLLAQAPEADYYAFSDQDDLWLPEKLTRALALMADVPAATPALYGARTLYVTADNQPLYPSRLFTKPLCFANALVQSFAGANTMLLNRTAQRLLAEYASLPVVGHDWWAYQLISGVGGVVRYDPEPCLRYRQHAHNVLGQNVSLRAKLARIRGLFGGMFRQWNDTQLLALARVSARLLPLHQQQLARFVKARQQPLAPRLWGLYTSGIHRQTLLGNLGLVVAALTNRI